MRLVVISGSRSIDIRVPDSNPALLRQAERTARRLLTSLTTAQEEKAPEEEQPFGFALSAQAEQAEPPIPREHEATQEDRS
jgi:hypothetical protein